SPRDRASAWNWFNGQFEPLLKANREVVFRAAVTAVGDQPTASDWVTLFHGLIDRPGTSGPEVTVRCRDLAKRLMYTYIYEAEEFGDDDDPEPADEVIQAIIDRYIANNAP